MGKVGIITNPASGRDIRRLVSYATTIDNYEKVNIVKRIVLAAQAMGVNEFVFMPDTFKTANVVINDLTIDERLYSNCEILDMTCTGCKEDTICAAELMEQHNVGCLVVLGGDGTSRAASKKIHNMPILPVSTGTNNVYPQMVEGTVAGMAAGIIAQNGCLDALCIRDKRIEVSVNGELRDIALIDAVVSRNQWVGAKAIWDMSQIEHIFVTRAHPASIGFSAIAGCLEMIDAESEKGFALTLAADGNRTEVDEIIKVKAPIAAGLLEEIRISRTKEMPIDETIEIRIDKDCMIALDGEREIRVHDGDVVSFCIKRNGPLRVQMKKTLEYAVRKGLYQI